MVYIDVVEEIKNRINSKKYLRDTSENLEELWKPIKDYQDIFEVSNYGNIRLIVKRNNYQNYPEYHNAGFSIKSHGTSIRVILTKDNSKKSFSLAKLVYNHFKEGGEFARNITYIDGDFKNCSINNLMTGKLSLFKRGVNSKVIDEIIQTLSDIIIEETIKEHHFILKYLGKFELVQVQERKRYDLNTRKETLIKGYKTIRFKLRQTLKEKINVRG